MICKGCGDVIKESSLYFEFDQNGEIYVEFECNCGYRSFWELYADDEIPCTKREHTL